MNFLAEYSDLLEFKEDANLPEIGIGTVDLYPELNNPYKYCSTKTLTYINNKLGLPASSMSKFEIVNPLQVTTVPNLLYCGLIYHLDLLEMLEAYSLTEEHFTNIRLMLYLISLVPKFGVKSTCNLGFIKKIKPEYLKYALFHYHPFRIDPLILNDKEIYDAFINSKIPENYSVYDARYQRFLALHTIDTDIFKVLTKELFKTTNIYKVVTQTIQSNLEKIIIESGNLLDMMEKIGMYPVSLDPGFDIRDHFLENLIYYIHHTDPTNSITRDIYQAIESGKVPEFLSRLSDQEIINVCDAFVPYSNRNDLIRKMTLISGSARFFMSPKGEATKGKICYGRLGDHIEYTARELEICFTQSGFYNADRSIEFSLFDINELIKCLAYYPNLINLINLCKRKIKNFK